MRDDAPPYPGDLFEHLRAFVTLALLVQRRERSAFTRAAQRLSVDVSVLRRRMQSLEAYFGAPMLEGHGAGLALTPKGAALSVDATRALSLVSDMRAGRPDRARLRIACTGTFLSEVLPPVLRRLRSSFPDLELQVSRRGSHACSALLAEGALDVAIVRSEARPTGLLSAFAGKDRFWAALPQKSALARRARLTPRALGTLPLIGYVAPSFTMERVSRVLEPSGVAPWIEVQGKTAALAYVAEGLGVAFVSALAGQTPAHRGVVMRDVTSLFSPASFWLVWRKAELAPWERAFVHAVAGR